MMICTMRNEYKTDICENNILQFSKKFDDEIMISTNGVNSEYHHPVSELENNFSTYPSVCLTCRYDICDM